MKQLDYGRGYRYAHDEAEGFAAGETYFPDGMAGPNFYRPTTHGLEAQIAAKLARLRDANAAAVEGPDQSA
jgi:putative ATPase